MDEWEKDLKEFPKNKDIEELSNFIEELNKKYKVFYIDVVSVLKGHNDEHGKKAIRGINASRSRTKRG